WSQSKPETCLLLLIRNCSTFKTYRKSNLNFVFEFLYENSHCRKNSKKNQKIITYKNFGVFAFKLFDALSQTSLNVDPFGMNFTFISFPRSTFENIKIVLEDFYGHTI
ncbi:hypothetical protein BpHYR1_002507, partial [Brachionus plicatilis]